MGASEGIDALYHAVGRVYGAVQRRLLPIESHRMVNSLKSPSTIQWTP